MPPHPIANLLSLETKTLIQPPPTVSTAPVYQPRIKLDQSELSSSLLCPDGSQNRRHRPRLDRSNTTRCIPAKRKLTQYLAKNCEDLGCSKTYMQEKRFINHFRDRHYQAFHEQRRCCGEEYQEGDIVTFAHHIWAHHKVDRGVQQAGDNGEPRGRPQWYANPPHYYSTPPTPMPSASSPACSSLPTTDDLEPLDYVQINMTASQEAIQAWDQNEINVRPRLHNDHLLLGYPNGTFISAAETPPFWDNM